MSVTRTVQGAAVLLGCLAAPAVQAAIVSGYGATADVGTYGSCASICLRPGGLDAQLVRGGELATSAAAGLDNASGMTSASAAFTGDVFSPVLRTRSGSSSSRRTASDAIALAIQAWSYSGTATQDFRIDLSLTGTIDDSPAGSEGRIRGDAAVYLFPDAGFPTFSLATFLLEVVPGSPGGAVLARDTLFLAPSFDASTGLLDFTLNPGDEVFVLMQLETKSERGAEVDAASTFQMTFAQGNTAQLQATALPAVTVPAPSAALLLLVGGLGVIGARRRSVAGTS